MRSTKLLNIRPLAPVSSTPSFRTPWSKGIGSIIPVSTKPKWFSAFDDRKLVMIFQEHMRNGRMSNFFHMNSPSREHD